MSLPTRNRPAGNELQNEINRMFTRLADTESTGATAGWTPAVDIYEYLDRYELYVDLPGVDLKTIDITLDNGILAIDGERGVPKTPESDQVLHRRTERGYGRFHRRFTMPDTVDVEKVKAVDQSGVLEITIPKQAKAQPRRIEIGS